MAVVLLLACHNGMRPPQAGAPLLSPADTNPLNAYDAARPEWFLVGVYEFSHLFPGEWGIVPIFIVPGLLLVIVLAMPFVGKHWIGQSFNVLFTLLLLGGVVWLTHQSYAKDRARSGPAKGDCRRAVAGQSRLPTDPAQPGHPAQRRA